MGATTAERNGTFPHDARSAAEIYLALGLAPIALPGRSKGAGLPDGWQHQRLVAADLDNHFPPDETRNVGILNGSPSTRHLDVDLDAVEARRIAGYLLPKTGWIFGRPGSPRSHWIYKADADLATAAITYKDIDGTMLVELRGSGGLTVYPPSLHKETGERIAWERFDEPGQVLIVELRRTVAELAAAALIACHWPAEGSRDEAALALTGGLLRAGWQEERVGPFVFAVATAAQDEEARMRAGKARGTADKLASGKRVFGWPHLADLMGSVGGAVVKKAREWLGMGEPAAMGSPGAKGRAPVRTLPPFVPFPMHTLPPVLAQIVACAASAIGCDESMAALAAIAAAAGCIGNARALLLKRGWVEPCIFWTLSVNESGSQKTPAYNAAIDPLVSIQMDLYDAHKELVEGHKEQLVEWEADSREDRGQKPEPPAEPVTFLTADTTIEALGVMLEDRPKGLLVARDELDAWFASFARYRGGKSAGTDRPQWLELHRAGTLRVDRLTRDKKRVAVRRANVSLTGTIQLAVLARALDEEAMQSGLAARFLMAMPPRRKRVWTENELPEEVVDRYRNLLLALLALPLEDEKKRKPYVLGLSSGAKRLWVEFYNSWAQEQFNADGEQAAAFAKIEAYASRFMLLHHVVSHVASDTDDLVPVTEASAKAGIELARWFAAEAVRIYGTLAESEEQRGSRRLVEYIRAHDGRVTCKALQQTNRRRYPTSGDADEALEALVRAGQGTWEARPATARGGRPTREFVLAKAPDETNETSLDDEGAMEPSNQKAPDDTRKPTNEPAGFQAADGVSSVSSGAQIESGRPTVAQEPPGEAQEVSSDMVYKLVTRPEELPIVLSALDDTAFVGLDTETTGLDSRTARVRLLALSCDTCDGGTFTYLLDLFALPTEALAPVWQALAERAITAHNAVFDLGFLAPLGFTPEAKVHDTMLMSRVLYAGARERHGLDECVRREMGEELDKEMQKSNWSGILTGEQLTYAARDAAVLRPLHKVLAGKIAEAKMVRTVEIESRCLPAVTWMGSMGVAVDRKAWSALTTEAEAAASTRREQMTALAPTMPGEMFVSWNFDSPAEAKKLFSALGVEVESTDDDTLAGIAHPIASLLRQYREAMKKTGTYGTAWLKHVADDGRVYAKWNQLGAAATGRMSCSDPNMQQLPRDKAYRRCVVAPAGRVLVKADYSQIELRIAAKVSGDPALLEAYRHGEDLHTRTARTVLGVREVTKEHRQLAKSLNFGLLYGMGAKNFRQYAKTQYGVELTEGQATEYRTAFFRTYPGLANWHRRVGAGGDSPVETRTLAGRRRLQVARFTEKLNTPVQGTGADGLKLAMALLWERREQMPGTFPVLAVHDEIVLEADDGQAGAAASWLKKAMLDGMAPLIDPVPVEVEVKIARTWGGD